jgi:hypothetical protein
MPPLPIELFEVASVLDVQALKPNVATRKNIDVKKIERGLESVIPNFKSHMRDSPLEYFKFK